MLCRFVLVHALLAVLPSTSLASNICDANTPQAVPRDTSLVEFHNPTVPDLGVIIGTSTVSFSTNHTAVLDSQHSQTLFSRIFATRIFVAPKYEPWPYHYCCPIRYNSQGIEIEPRWDYPNKDEEFEDVLTRGGGITVPLDPWEYNNIQGGGSKKGSKSQKK
ncbi:hypothetical protein QBC34DRAFT_493649 [Podospora aff. communis PSN243]|uniref:Uncharacterized protein n=1 Tax=Podospora aff. communis PSN243 TaxID=3040156 RepID=A0AAV9GRB2_9PEZI|nr:hypothetical protein QBC34DRAFT_493649 [Podospora aff. communis PSN243]